MILQEVEVLDKVEVIFMKKRKDSKGRALNEGESQRPTGTYQYKWTEGS